MVHHDALGMTCGARGVVQRDGLPFVSDGGGEIGGGRRALQQREPVAAAAVLGEDEQGHSRSSRRCGCHRGVGRIRDQQSALAVVEDPGHGIGVEAGVDGVQDGPECRDGEMCGQHLRSVRAHHGYDVAGAEMLQCRDKAQDHVAERGPGQPFVAPNHCRRCGMRVERPY